MRLKCFVKERDEEREPLNDARIQSIEIGKLESLQEIGRLNSTTALLEARLSSLRDQSERELDYQVQRFVDLDRERQKTNKAVARPTCLRVEAGIYYYCQQPEATTTRAC